MKNDQVLVLTGPPGSGKSTIVGEIQKIRQATAIQPGRLLRDQVEQDTQLGQKVRPFLEKGELAPSELVNQVVEESARAEDSSLLVFDGYPRNREEVRHFMDMENSGLFSPAVVLILHLTRETAIKRISGRRRCPECGSSYHVDFDPPREPDRCDDCQGRLEQREDDRPEVVERRLDIFEAETLPMIEVFQALRPERSHNLSAEKSLDSILSAVVSLLS